MANLKDLVQKFVIDVGGDEHLDDILKTLKKIKKEKKEVEKPVDIPPVDTSKTNESIKETNETLQDTSEKSETAKDVLSGLSEKFLGVDLASLKMAGGIGLAIGAVIALGLAVVSTTRALIDMAIESARGASEQAVWAKRLGLTNEEFARTNFMMKSVGVQTEDYADGLKTLGERINEVSLGNQEYTGIFKKLGVEIKNSDGTTRNLNDVLLDTGASLNKLSSDAERVDLISKIFGDEAGIRMLPLFQMGEDGIKQLEKDFEDLGGFQGDQVFEDSKNATMGFNKLQFAVDNLKLAFSANLIPIISWFSEKIGYTIGYITNLIKGTSVLETTLIALGAVLSVFAGILLLSFTPFLLLIAPIVLFFGVIFLIVEDFITLLKGGKSVIGEFLKSVLGVEAGEKSIQAIKDGFDTAIQAVKVIISWISKISFDAIKKGAKLAFEYAVKYTKSAIETFIRLYDTLMLVYNIIVEIGSVLASVFKDVSKVLLSQLSSVLDTIYKVIESIQPFAKTAGVDFSYILKQLKDAKLTINAGADYINGSPILRDDNGNEVNNNTNNNQSVKNINNFIYGNSINNTANKVLGFELFKDVSDVF